MSVSHDSAALDAIDDGRASLSSTFLDLCVKLRKIDPSILPELGRPLQLFIRRMYEREVIELADALLENTRVTYLETTHVAAASSGLKKNTTLRELTIELSPDVATVSLILTSVRDHPFLRRLCLQGNVVDLNRLEIALLSETSKIIELDIERSYGGLRITGLTPVLRALARRPTLIKRLRYCPLGYDEARLLGMALCNTLSLQSMVLMDNTLLFAELAELAPALYHNTSIKVINMSRNILDDMESAELLQDIILNNNIMTDLHLAGNTFGYMTGGAECFADGLGSNSTLLEVDL